MPSVSVPVNSEPSGTIVSSVEGYRPKVLHLINHFQVGGTERQAVLLLQHLDRTRYDVRLAVLSKAGPLFEEVARVYPHVEEYPLTSFYNVNALKQVLRLRRYLLTHHIQIIHTHEFWSGLLAVAASRFTRTRIIASQRHLRMSDRLVHHWGRRVLNAIADRVLVNAEAIRKQILETSRNAPAKVVVVRNGLTLVEDRLVESCNTRPDGASSVRRSARSVLINTLGISDTSMIVGMVANLRPVKGHRHLIEAASRILQAHPDVHFVLIGEGDLRTALERQVKELGIDGHVHFMGHREDARLLTAGFDMAVLASFHEGMPNTVLEAMAAGVPVVATAVGGVKELIVDQETGFLVPPGDTAAMVDRLEKMLVQNHLRAAIGLRGHEFVHATFGMERMIASVQYLYDELLDARSEGQ
ncbi:MAG TPA: glycosyltransferase [Nitrospiraceae bacterium]|nr:glycosyltransferase [Nitrospiraceae bacterium]